MLKPTTVIAAALTLAAADAHAVPYGTMPVTVDLGGGMTADRYVVHISPTYRAAEGFGWRANGFMPPPGSVNMYAAARGGRIVALVPAGPTFSDDRGAHWYPARWDGGQQPRSIAFDARSDFGAAVGDGGSLWTTEDRGETWRLRRDNAGQMLVDVAVSDTTVGFADNHGGVWVSFDGGTSVRTIAEDSRTLSTPELQAHEGAVWVLVGGRVWWRAGQGMVERIDSPAGPSR